MHPDADMAREGCSAPQEDDHHAGLYQSCPGFISANDTPGNTHNVAHLKAVLLSDPLLSYAWQGPVRWLARQNPEALVTTKGVTVPRELRASAAYGEHGTVGWCAKAAVHNMAVSVAYQSS